MTPEQMCRITEAANVPRQKGTGPIGLRQATLFQKAQGNASKKKVVNASRHEGKKDHQHKSRGGKRRRCKRGRSHTLQEKETMKSQSSIEGRKDGALADLRPQAQS